jgi:Protein of unknown function (DUF1579)
MKIRARVLLSLFVVSVVLAGVALAQEPAQPAGPSQAEMEAMMKAMAPGEQHKHMARMVGDWTFTNKFYMAPGAPPTESSGTMHAEALMGGRYVEHHWKGNMMGMPFEGRGTDAYDNGTKQYVSSWIDNMGTGIMMQTGTCDDAGKTCTYSGETFDAMSGKKITMRSVITWVDNDTFKNEMYGPDPTGKEAKMMEIVAKRKK